MEQRGTGDQTMQGFDALLPAEMAEKAGLVGVQKTRMDWVSQLALAVLAGAFIALGAMFATTVLAGADGVLPFGVSRLMAGLVFSLGLVLVIVGCAVSFTGNTVIWMAWAGRRIRTQEMLRVWLVVYVGNLIGALGTAVLVFLSGQYLAGGGAVAEVALKLAEGKTMLPFDRALFLGVLCNVLVCLAVWLSYGARTITDKVVAVVLPVSAFVAAGFEHSVANMYLIPVALFMKAWGPPDVLARLHDGASALSWSGFL